MSDFLPPDGSPESVFDELAIRILVGDEEPVVFESEQQDPFLARNETRQSRPLKSATQKIGPSRFI